MTPALLEPPAAMPVTRDLVKAHLRIDGSADDAYLDELIAAATGFVEARTALGLISRKWRIYLDEWPPGPFLELPVAPVRTVLGITVFKANGMPTPLPASAARLDPHSSPARLWLGDRPQSELPLNGVEIDLQGGFGDSPADIPPQLVRAILLLVAGWYELRGAGEPELRNAVLPAGIEVLLAPYRRIRL